MWLSFNDDKNCLFSLQHSLDTHLVCLMCKYPIYRANTINTLMESSWWQLQYNKSSDKFYKFTKEKYSIWIQMYIVIALFILVKLNR